MTAPLPGEIDVWSDNPTKRHLRRWEEVGRVAGRQWGVISVGQLRTAGFTPGAIKHRTSAGQLRPVHRGVYAVGHGHVQRDGRFLAAVLAVGGGAVLSHRSAAVRWGLIREESGPVDVTVARRVRRREGIAVHVTHLPDRDALRRRALPVTTPTRTLLDLAATSLRDRGLRRAVNEALVQRLTSVPTLERALDAARPRRGVRRLAALLATARPTETGLEDELLLLCAEHGLPLPETQRWVGPYRVDALYPDHDLVVEVDGGRYHGTPLRRADDAARQAVIEATGLRVLRLGEEDLAKGSARGARRLEAALRSARPRC